MDALPMAAYLSTSARGSLAHSALPGAPVAADPVRREHAVTVRAGLASVLHRLADGVAPHRAECLPAR